METFMKKTVAWLRTEKALKTLTIIILAAGILDFLSGFLTYDYGYGDYIFFIGSIRFINLLSNLLTLAPKVLLALYVFYFRSKWNPTFFRFVFLTAIACGSLLSIISIVPRQLVNGMIFYALINTTSRLSSFAFMLVYLFALPTENTVPSLTPEESLKLLKEKYDLGILTQAEYEAQKSQILENL